MSITIRAIAIDLSEYRSLKASGDVALIERVLTESAELIAADDADLLSFRPDHLPIGLAVRDIIMGTLREGQSAALSYGLAAVLLAEHLGERIDDDALSELPSFAPAAIDSAIRDMVAELHHPSESWPLLATVLRRGPALDIPWLPETLPNGMGYLTDEEVVRAAETIAQLAPEQADSARGLAMIYGTWITLAAETGRALILEAG